MDNLVKTTIHQMARLTNTTLDHRHYEILNFAYEHYHKYRVGPLYHILYKSLGVTREELKSLFPHELNSVYSWVGIPIQTTNDGCKPIAHVDVDKIRHVYLDHNSTTYIRPEVKKVLNNYFDNPFGFGNPSNSTVLGKNAYEEIEKARSTIAKTLDVLPEEIIFTGSGSEANNLAIKGIAFQHLDKKGHIISSKYEHSSVLKTLRWLETLGFQVSYLDITPDGLVDISNLEKMIKKNTILVSIMAVNNEIGTINPIDKIGTLCNTYNVPFMVDAIQAFAKIQLAPKATGISLLSLSGHKIYAPKGIGALYISKDTKISPLIHGGSQEHGQRAGTENIAYIAALAKAAKIAVSERVQEYNRFKTLQTYFLEKLKNTTSDFIINGSLNNRLTNNLNIGFKGIDSGALLLSLNEIGIYVSSGSACSAGSTETSHVIRSLGTDTRDYGIIRFSFGLENTLQDIDYLFQYLPSILKQLKNSKTA